VLEKMRSPFGCVIVFGLVAGCSDDTQGPVADLGTKKELTVAGDGLPPDQGNTGRPDMTPGICDPICVAKDFSLCVKDPSDNECVECLKDGDCTGNPGALGSKCDTQNKFCICATDADCVGNNRGNKCDTANQMCVCATDADCKDWICVGGTVKTCRPKCKADGDCDASAPKCDVATGKCIACAVDTDCKSATNKYCLAGKCVPCKTDGDCKAPTPFCDATAGKCTECKAPADCASSQNGSQCVAGKCACAADADCGSLAAWGKKCITSLASKRCGCDADAECAGNGNGPVCYKDFNKCSCKADGECSKAPYTKCALPYDTATYAHCQKPCTGDQECKDRLFGGSTAGFNKCSNGKCVVCTADADCASNPTNKHCNTTLGKCVACILDNQCGAGSPFCDPTANKCVECKAAGDCAGSPNGPACAASTCACTADGECAGSYVWGKKCITSGTAKRCGCSADPDCTGAGTGKKCYTQFSKCACAADGECTAPNGKCTYPYSGASYQACQKPCTSDPECANKFFGGSSAGFKKCSTGKCVACTVDADCSANTTAKLCHPASGECNTCKTNAECAANPYEKTCDAVNGCVECIKDTDCTTSSLGSKCDEQQLCICSADADCVSNLNGKKCDTQNLACGCAVDGDCPTGKTCTGTTSFNTKVCK
jgi:hypothetical protein